MLKIIFSLIVATHASTTRTICGSNDMRPMLNEPDSMKKMGTPIGFYKSRDGLCSGTLIDKDLFLTARHCESPCSGITVTFGYHQKRNQETFKCREIVEKGKSGANNDWMIVRLDGNPGVAWGWYPPSDKEMKTGQELLMIHHPGGTPMKVSTKECSVTGVSGGLLSHRCDTEGGSSGGGILVPDYEKPENTRVVGVHTLGGCDKKPTSANMGPAMRDLAKKSATLRSLLKD